MMPLALMMKSRGFDVCGSDRSLDQGRTPERFSFLQSQGIDLFPQDGSGVTRDVAEVIVSSAVEETVSDYQAALAQNIPIRKRADLLASFCNESECGIAVAGTSGKSTTAGMIGWILTETGRDPDIVNGAVMKNFVTEKHPFASARVGRGPFVAEADESDGSIALYKPSIAVLNNIARDHKEMDELHELFKAFLERAERVVLNLDNDEVARLHFDLSSQDEAKRQFTYSLNDPQADFYASEIIQNPYKIDFVVHYEGISQPITLPCPGLHNVSNALAAIAAVVAAGVFFKDAASALSSFKGIARRFDVVGQAAGVTVIDDFAHNPDKITALLCSLRQFEGRLLILFQPHGYGPLHLMKDDLAACFFKHLHEGDLLLICDPLYLGGTTDKSIGSDDLVRAIVSHEGAAHYIADRQDAAKHLISQASKGDRIVIMGARDDGLSALACDVYERLKNRLG